MQRTVVILAGGKGQRFNSRDKCFIVLNRKTLLQHVVDNLAEVADEIIIAARDEQQGRQIRQQIPNTVTVVFDSISGFGPLAGVLSGLERASTSYSLVIGCDMPFVNRRVVDLLFTEAERGNYSAVVPTWENGMVEPLHAVYKKEPTLAAVRNSIKNGNERMFNVLLQLKNVHYLPVARIQALAPELMTFRNINTPDELQLCAALSDSEEKPQSDV
ncbi:MAG: molybdenum cofactor guanylyltransferase [Methanomicrobia archaeon]|nr:molybdenum cofactor guanylyltransferase [Methanomicrobia archaeon]